MLKQKAFRVQNVTAPQKKGKNWEKHRFFDEISLIKKIKYFSNSKISSFLRRKWTKLEKR